MTLDELPKKTLTEAIVQSGRKGSHKYKDFQMVLSEIKGTMAPNPKEISYQALSAAKIAQGEWHTIHIRGNPALSTLTKPGWTWYLGEYPTGSGGHGSGTGVGQTEFLINIPNTNEDWFVCVVGSVIVTTKKGAVIKLGPGEYIKLNAAGPVTPNPQPNTDRDVATFLKDVKAELIALGLPTSIT